MTLLATLVLRAPRVGLPSSALVARVLEVALGHWPGLAADPGEAQDGLQAELATRPGLEPREVQVGRNHRTKDPVDCIVVWVRGIRVADAHLRATWTAQAIRSGLGPR